MTNEKAEAASVAELREAARALRNNNKLHPIDKAVTSLDIVKMKREYLILLIRRANKNAEKSGANAAAPAPAEPAAVVPAPNTAPEARPGEDAAAADMIINISAIVNMVKTAVSADFSRRIEDVASRALSAAEKAAEAARQGAPRELTIKFPELDPVKIKTPHENFELLLKCAMLKRPVLMSGPAGSGKTSAGRMLAKALGRDFRCLSVCSTTSESKILGFINIHGQYVDQSGLAHCIRNGGIFLMDEIDAANSNIAVVVNDLAAKMPGEDYYQLPSGEIIKIHENFLFIAAANTWGHGGGLDYVGRNKLDGATLDRFVNKISWDYDEKLENALSRNAAFTKRIQALRAAARKLHEKVIISPRASIHGGDLLAAGVVDSIVGALDIVLWPGISADVRERLEREAK